MFEILKASPDYRALTPDVIIHEDLSMEVTRAAKDVYKTPVLSLLSQNFVKRLVSASGLSKPEVDAFLTGMSSTMAPDPESWSLIKRAYEAKQGSDARLFALQESFMEHRILKNVASRLRIRSQSPTAAFLDKPGKPFSCAAEDIESRM
jgi:hypothetical protein